MKKNIKSIVIVLCIVLLTGLIVFATRYICKYEVITLDNNMASIRLPGEFNGKVNVLYNEKYLTQEKENSVLNLKFSKEGYYYVKILDYRYVFCYLKDTSSNYTIDLLQHEYKDIVRKNTNERIVIKLIILLVVVLFYVFIFVWRKVRNRKGKKTTVVNNMEDF